MQAFLSTTYFGPVQWYQKLCRCSTVYMERCDSYRKQTYRNRCVIAAANGPQVLTVPVERPSGTLAIDCLEDGGYGLTDRYMYFAEDGGEYTALSNELAYSFIYQVTGLSWGSCVDYKAEPKTLGDYGLDTPSV